MLSGILNILVCGIILFSLLFIDKSLGNGYIDMVSKNICKIFCFLKKSILSNVDTLEQSIEGEKSVPVNFSIFIAEMLTLVLTIFMLKKYKQRRGRDKIDELLLKSNEMLRQTNEFLERWRLRKVNWQIPAERGYLDEEPLDVKPLKLEVPILHMAIVDTRGTTRSQPERGDAGDAIHVTDSTLLSVSSLAEEEDTESILDPCCESKRYLWNVIEEDSSGTDD